MIKLSTVIFSTIVFLSSNSAFAEQPNTQKISVEAAAKQTIHTISINKADAKSLTLLKGIGVKTAKAIIDYRSAHGDFKSIGELLKVKGVGLKVLAKNEERLSI